MRISSLKILISISIILIVFVGLPSPSKGATKLNILKLSEAEILKIAEPIWDDIVKASNERNWKQFSKYMPIEYATKEVKKSVEKQWKYLPALTTLSDRREYLGILRKNDSVVVLWKQWSTKVEGEFLGMLVLKEINSEIKTIGIRVQ